MTKQTLLLFWRATWRYKWLFSASEIASTIWLLTNAVIPPLLLSQVINKLTSAQVHSLHYQDFSHLLWLYVASVSIALIAGRVMMLTYLRYETNVVRDLEVLCFKTLQKHSLSFFADNFSGALVAKVNRLTNAYTQVEGAVTGDLGILLRNFLIIIVILFFINGTVASVFFVWTILFCYSVFYMHRKKLVYSRAASNAQTRVTARLADIIANTLTIRSFARGTVETKHFQELSHERRNLRFRTALFGDFIRIYKTVAMFGLQILVLILCIKFALSGKISIGSVVLIQVYIFRLLDHLWNFGKTMDKLEEAVADAAEMTEVLMTPHEVEDPVEPEPVRITDGAIEFKKVVFHYEEEASRLELFRNLDVKIPAGQKVGLVGPSGGGKTTLTKLMLRFMDIQSGEILIDGQNIAKLRQDDLRSQISYVPQEPLLFHRSIYENIAYGDTSASHDAVVEAAKKSRADEFIKELPKGYDTIVGERGVKLSGGQRQRVAIARAMLKNAPVVLLDEATSSLDSVSERFITEALDDLMAKRTTLVIAHRLSTIRKLDRILVMDDGRVIEDGTHAELLKKKGLYATLWAHQTGEMLGEK